MEKDHERAFIDIIQRIVIIPNIELIEDTVWGIYMDFGKKDALALIDEATERLKKELEYELKGISRRLVRKIREREKKRREREKKRFDEVWRATSYR